MLTSIQSAGVAPEVNLKITQVTKQAKGIHPGFETQGRCHHKQGVNRGISGTTKGLKSSKNLKKNTIILVNFIQKIT